MAFDGITVAALTSELRRELTDGRINKIAQPESDELLFTIKTPQGTRRLYLSASASLPLVYLTESNKPGPMNAPNFCMLLRKHIGSGRIVSVTQPGLERMISIEIEHRNELGDLCRKHLNVEIMGKHSNIIFCDETGRIIDSIKHVSAHMSSVREVLPGRDYFLPDTMKKLDPLTVTADAFTEALQAKPCALGKAIYTSFTGISPLVAEDLCEISGIDSSLPAAELSADYLLHLYRQFTLLMEDVKQGVFSPVIYYKGGVPAEFCARNLEQFERDQTVTALREASISTVLATYYAEKNTVTRMRGKSADLRHVIQTALERNIKKYDLQLKQMEDTKDREKYKVYGELINVYGYGLHPGEKTLTCQNYYTSEEITIPLDVTITPQENAQKYFAKYNKQKRTFEALATLTEETSAEISYLESILSALDIARSEEDLNQIKEELAQTGYVKRRNLKKKGKTKNQPLHFLNADGFHIYVGKNNLQNEELTFSFANGGDWWFHAKKAPGSHVILKTEGREVPDSAFEDAGRLAAYYSKKRGGDKVEIDYVERKHVKKPNGGKPGFVVYYTNYSLVIDSDIAGIQIVES